MKLLLCFGTRPEAIKMAPVIHELDRQKMVYEICLTAQHREMLDQVTDFFGIKPDYDLNLMKPGQHLNSLSATILSAMDEVLNKVGPDMVLVQGDTTTAFVVALAAYNRGIKVAHIEAGLRTYDLKAPFPEEGNRQLISRIASKHFAPTQMAKEYLLKEGIAENLITLTGNTVVDALEFGRQKLDEGFTDDHIVMLKRLVSQERKLILVTGHRRENFGKGIQELCQAIWEISKKKMAQVIFPVHLNPQVKEPVAEYLRFAEDVHLVPPLSYPGLLWLLEKCDLIISDSGGIQEEAPSFRKPVLVTRMLSERMEGVKAGFSIITGSSKEEILRQTTLLLGNNPDFGNMANPYGDGRAAKKIVSNLKTSHF